MDSNEQKVKARWPDARAMYHHNGRWDRGYAISLSGEDIRYPRDVRTIFDTAEFAWADAASRIESEGEVDVNEPEGLPWSSSKPGSRSEYAMTQFLSALDEEENAVMRREQMTLSTPTKLIGHLVKDGIPEREAQSLLSEALYKGKVVMSPQGVLSAAPASAVAPEPDWKAEAKDGLPPRPERFMVYNAYR